MPSKIRGGNNDKHMADMHVPRVSSMAKPGGAAASSLLTNLTGAWELGEVSGDRADSTANALTLSDNATVTSAAGIGGVGTAAQFTAVQNEFLSRTSETNLLLVGSCEWHCWIYMDSHTSLRTVFSKDDQGGNRDYWIDVGTDGKPYLLVFTNVSFYQAIWGSALSDGTWYAIDAYYDSVANEIGISVNNGTFITTPISGTPKATAAVFRVGKRDTGFFDGRIQFLRFWKGRNLTAGERTSLYAGGAGIAYPF